MRARSRASRRANCAEVRAVDSASPIGRRLLELGFRPGTALRVIRRAPLGDPTTYELRGSRFCLRRAEAERVEVALRAGRPMSAAIRLGLLGAPNSGKTTLFNALTGMRAKVGELPRRHRRAARGADRASARATRS